MNESDRRNQDRAAALVRRTPIYRERIHVPPSQRYGSRWKSLPVVDDFSRQIIVGERIGGILVGLALAGVLYILIRALT